MIDPGTKLEGEEYLAYNRRRWGGDGWTGHLRHSGKPVGANFANWKWWPHTLKAHQLVAYFEQKRNNQQQEDTTDRTNQALFEVLYEEGENPSSVDVLVESVGVKKLGLSDWEAEELRLFLEQDKAAAQVKHEISEGRKKFQISGVPYFVIGKEGQKPYGFSGAQPPETFLEIFEELAG